MSVVQVCEWFVLCTNEATHERFVAALGFAVPCCDRCGAKDDAIAEETRKS